MIVKFLRRSSQLDGHGRLVGCAQNRMGCVCVIDTVANTIESCDTGEVGRSRAQIGTDRKEVGCPVLLVDAESWWKAVALRTFVPIVRSWGGLNPKRYKPIVALAPRFRPPEIFQSTRHPYVQSIVTPVNSLIHHFVVRFFCFEAYIVVKM